MRLSPGRDCRPGGDAAVSEREGSIMRKFVVFNLLLLCVPAAGCNRGETNEERLQRLLPNAKATTPVSGNVTVDGSPVKDVWVTLHLKDGDGTLLPKGRTDEDGNFQIMSYIA